jgi:glycerol-3-phosphate dehydrogenase (NAD(P)+)
VVEGVYSAKAAKALAEKYQVNMPITEAIAKVLFEDVPAAEAVTRLLLRDKTVENPLLPWN